MTRTIIILSLQVFSTTVFAQEQANFSFTSQTDPMTRETSEGYSGVSSSGFTFAFFCDTDGLNFSIAYNYMIYESDTPVEYRVGDSAVTGVTPNLVSTDGERIWFWGNRPLLAALVNGIATQDEVFIRIYERVNQFHTFSLLGNEDIFRLDCAVEFRNPDATASTPDLPTSFAVNESPDEVSDCSDTCKFANDGECDDGGPNSLYEVCEYGTDCGDCGPRN